MMRKAATIVGIDEAGRAASRRAPAAKIVIGIDEAGRGPLAGPLVIAAIAGLRNRYLVGIKDSKKLTPLARERWYKILREKAVCRYVSIRPELIDTRGIVPSTRAAIGRLVKKMCNYYKLPTLNYKLLLDGSLYAPSDYHQKTIIKGDERVPIIAAASIIAKVVRDRKMTRLDAEYPNYGFAKHKGYGTRAHQAAIIKFGLSDIHRRSFCSKLI